MDREKGAGLRSRLVGAVAALQNWDKGLEGVVEEGNWDCGCVEGVGSVRIQAAGDAEATIG